MKQQLEQIIDFNLIANDGKLPPFNRHLETSILMEEVAELLIAYKNKDDMEKNIFNIGALRKNGFFKKSKCLVSYKKYKAKNSGEIEPIYFMSYKTGKHIDIKYGTYIFLTNYKKTYFDKYPSLVNYPFLLNYTDIDSSLSIDKDNIEEVLNQFYGPTIVLNEDFINQNDAITFLK